MPEMFTPEERVFVPDIEKFLEKKQSAWAQWERVFALAYVKQALLIQRRVRNGAE